MPRPTPKAVLPPGHYNAVIDSVRKVKGKDAFTVRMTIPGTGHRIVGRITYDPTKGDGAL